MSDSAYPRFVVKEYADGQPWIALEEMGALPGFERKVIGFDLVQGTTIPDAEAIARDLQDKLRAFKVVQI